MRQVSHRRQNSLAKPGLLCLAWPYVAVMLTSDCYRDDGAIEITLLHTRMMMPGVHHHIPERGTNRMR